MKRILTPLVALTSLLVGASAPMAHALIVYGNNAGSAGIYKMDVNTATGTATVVQTYSNTPSSGNGRGVVIVGNVLYSTVTGDSRIHKTDLTTNADLGYIQTSVGSMSTLGWDGSSFWTTDYAGSNRGFQISATGTTLKTLTFSEATGYMDGMEYFNGKLIVNNTDGGFGGSIRYSIYDLNGNLLTKDFIVAPSGTGIAYDGTNFLVSNVQAGGTNQIGYYDGTTGALIRNVTVTGGSWLVEDLSVDYAARTDTGGGSSTPDAGSTLGLAALAIGGLVALRRNLPGLAA